MAAHLFFFLLLLYAVHVLDLKMISIAVGSLNPVKIRSVVNGVSSALKIDILEISVEGFNAASEVPDQPLGDEETKRGAINRARNAFAAYFSKNAQYPTYAIGLEGGVQTVGGDMECFAWIAIFNGTQIGTARSGAFILPPRIRDLVNSGMELGDADDAVFGTTNAKQGDGTVGHLTKNVIDRTRYYEMAVVLAMIPFQWPDLYP